MTRQRFGTVTRVVSRALLVAGFAGGAWLLSSGGAHAAAPERTDPVRIDSTRADQAVVNLTTPVTRTATDLLHVVLPTAPRRHALASGAVANKAAASQAETAQQPAAALLRTIPSVLHALRPLTGAVGLGTGPLADLLTPVTDGLRTTLVPVAGRGEVQPRAVRQHAAPAPAPAAPAQA